MGVFWKTFIAPDLLSFSMSAWLTGRLDHTTQRYSLILSVSMFFSTSKYDLSTKRVPVICTKILDLATNSPNVVSIFCAATIFFGSTHSSRNGLPFPSIRTSISSRPYSMTQFTPSTPAWKRQDEIPMTSFSPLKISSWMDEIPYPTVQPGEYVTTVLDHPLDLADLPRLFRVEPVQVRVVVSARQCCVLVL